MGVPNRDFNSVSSNSESKLEPDVDLPLDTSIGGPNMIFRGGGCS